MDRIIRENQSEWSDEQMPLGGTRSEKCGNTQIFAWCLLAAWAENSDFPVHTNDLHRFPQNSNNKERRSVTNTNIRSAAPPVSIQVIC